MITFDTRGDDSKVLSWLDKLRYFDYRSRLTPIAKKGVSALASATPVESGQTASSWNYTIERSKDGFTISWTNTHREGGAPIAILLQYGHGTRNGGYVQGRDYINPAIRPIFDQMVSEMEKAVKEL